MKESETLEQLENDYWGEPPINSSSLIRTCYKLRQKKIRDYDADDLRVMINQNMGLDYLVPKSIDILKENPFIEANYYEGDLLKSVLSCDAKFWESHKELRDNVSMILRENMDKLDKLDSTSEIKDELKNLFEDFFLASRL